MPTNTTNNTPKNPIPPPPPLSQKFRAKKANILAKLSQGQEAGVLDASPKGSVDEEIRDLIELINSSEGFVTTSSCAGRVAVFAGGKGGGGEWLFTSHRPVELGEGEGEVGRLLFGGREVGIVDSPPLMGDGEGDVRLVSLKFEPLILHILTASLDAAQRALDAALGAGFRESGIVGARDHGPKDPATPMVGVRCQGLAFETVVAYFDDDGVIHPIVPETTLRYLLQLVNKRFVANEERKARFTAAFTASSTRPHRA